MWYESVIVEWLMGHDIGIAKHYLADNIKQEYSKFEQAIGSRNPHIKLCDFFRSLYELIVDETICYDPRTVS
jgi:hypothetical protein